MPECLPLLVVLSHVSLSRMGATVQVQADEDPAERGAACKPAKFLDFFRKLPVQGVALACSKTGIGLKHDGVMEYKVLLCPWWS